MAATFNETHSALVQMWLRVGDVVMPVAQVGGGRMILRSPHPVPAGSKGKLVISVDGQKKVYHVVLTHGCDLETGEVEFF